MATKREESRLFRLAVHIFRNLKVLNEAKEMPSQTALDTLLVFNILLSSYCRRFFHKSVIVSGEVVSATRKLLFP